MARVLIIEDDGELQHLLSISLNQEGHEVHYAFNGREGYEKCLQLQPDLALLDLMMPVLNGAEVLKLLLSNTLTQDMPVIIMTAYGDKAEALEKSFEARGVRAYLRKPFELVEMRALVRRMITQYPRTPAEPSEIAKGAVRLDIRYRTVWVNGKLLATLTPSRAKLLRALIESRGPVPKAKLMHALWGSDSDKKRNLLEKAIQRLRADLGGEGARVQTTDAGYELIG